MITEISKNRIALLRKAEKELRKISLQVGAIDFTLSPKFDLRCTKIQIEVNAFAETVHRQIAPAIKQDAKLKDLRKTISELENQLAL